MINEYLIYPVPIIFLISYLCLVYLTYFGVEYNVIGGLSFENDGLRLYKKGASQSIFFDEISMLKVNYIDYRKLLYDYGSLPNRVVGDDNTFCINYGETNEIKFNFLLKNKKELANLKKVLHHLKYGREVNIIYKERDREETL